MFVLKAQHLLDKLNGGVVVLELNVARMESIRVVRAIHEGAHAAMFATGSFALPFILLGDVLIAKER